MHLTRVSDGGRNSRQNGTPYLTGKIASTFHCGRFIHVRPTPPELTVVSLHHWMSGDPSSCELIPMKLEKRRIKVQLLPLK